MRNRVKELVDGRGMSVYQFWQSTGISRTTAYALYNKPEQYPGRDVMDAICRVLQVQPGEVLEYVEDEPAPKAKRSKGKAMQQQAIATVPTDEPRFNPGDCCKIPSGSRVFIDRYLGNKRYAVTWETGGVEDEFPEHLLEFICHAK